MTTTISVKCPVCQGSDIGVVERVLITSRVESYSRDASTNRLDANTLVETVDIDFDSAESVDEPWQCLGCKQTFTEEDLLISENEATA